MSKLISVNLTVDEIDALRANAITMHAVLQKDKHVNPETVNFWYKLQDKLMMAKIRQT